MSTNTVTVRLTLADLASAGIKSFQASIRQLQAQAAAASSAMNGSFGKLDLSFKSMGNGARMVGGLIKSAILPSVAAATAAVYGLTKGLEDAGNIELNNINTAGTYAALTKTSYADASKAITDLNNDLARSAAALPGATQDYKDIAGGILDNMVPAFRDASGVVDKSGLIKGVKTLATNFGVLGAQSQTASKDVSKFISKALGGGSESELGQLLFAENNPALLSFYIDELKKQGASIKNATTQQRAIALELASSKLVTDDVKKAASQSFSGVLEGFKSNLFDPNTGLFGLMRDLNTSTPEVESILSAVTKGLDAVVGENGLLSTIGRTLQLLGFKAIDPMLVLKNVVDGITGRIQAFNGYLRSLAAIFYVNRGNASFSNLKYVSKEIGVWIGNIINNSVRSLENIDLSFIVTAIGNIWTVIQPGLWTALTTIDWLPLSELLIKVLLAAVSGAVLYSTIVGAVGAFAASFSGVMGAAVLALGPVGLLAAAAALSVAYLFTQIIKNWDELKPLLIQAWDSVSTFLDSTVKLGWGLLTGNFQIIFESVRGLTSVASQAIDAMKFLFNTITGRVGTNDAAATANATASYSLADQRAIKSGAMTVGQAEGNVQQSIGNNAGGNDPMGLLAAAYRERQQAPAGSRLAIANSSEAIFNQGQQRVLGSALANRGGDSITFSPVFNISGPNPEQIAREVKRVFEQTFFQLQTEYLR